MLTNATYARVGQYFKWVGQSAEWVGHGLPGLSVEPPLIICLMKSLRYLAHIMNLSPTSFAWEPSQILAEEVELEGRMW